MRDDKWITRIFIGGPCSGQFKRIEEKTIACQVATRDEQDNRPIDGRLVSSSRMLMTVYRLRNWRYTFGIIEAMVAEGIDEAEAEKKLGEIAKKLTTTIVEEMQKEQAKNAND